MNRVNESETLKMNKIDAREAIINFSKHRARDEIQLLCLFINFLPNIISRINAWTFFFRNLMYIWN